MAYDEELAHRIRAVIGPRPGIVEKKMFGGLAFLLNGNMAVAAGSDGGLIVRAEHENGRRLIEETIAEPMTMRGKAMSGWLLVAASDLDDDELATWVDRGVGYAGSLPAK